jgi:hypothetical protein
LQGLRKLLCQRRLLLLLLLLLIVVLCMLLLNHSHCHSQSCVLAVMRMWGTRCWLRRS